MFKKKVAFALAVAMVTGSISGCGGFLKVSVGGKDIVNIGKAESTEKETEAMLETSEESKEEHTKKERKKEKRRSLLMQRHGTRQKRPRFPVPASG